MYIYIYIYISYIRNIHIVFNNEQNWRINNQMNSVAPCFPTYYFHFNGKILRSKFRCKNGLFL